MSNPNKPSGEKRKRGQVGDENLKRSAPSSRKAPKKTAGAREDGHGEVLHLEQQISQSNDRCRNIAKLQDIANSTSERPEIVILASVALCRVWCRFIALDVLVKRKSDNDEETTIKTRLQLSFRQYIDREISLLGSPDPTQQRRALTLLLQIVKTETGGQERQRAESAWRMETAPFPRTVKALLTMRDAEAAREEFVDRFAGQHDDVRFFTMLAIKDCLSSTTFQTNSTIESALDILSKIQTLPQSASELNSWYGHAPELHSHRLLSFSTHCKRAQACWLSIFRCPLTSSHRKVVLGLLTHQILPWFITRMEVLTDFLTDSFDAGGSLSLLALSGIFQLMTERNLDYPDFYLKLYSILDEELLLSKYRSRFFRLFEKFMSSTHLPAALVASFMKRLSRLALHAPPGAIIWIVPWIYNTMRKHPACNFMLHRTLHPAHYIYSANPSFREDGMTDPFRMEETDPMKSLAIESSLWELCTLRDHWHPNVATLAKIIGEPFTKREYQLEDFLDHGYTGLLGSELSKGLKKTVELEWEIPKRVISSEDGTGLNEMGALLSKAVEV